MISLSTLAAQIKSGLLLFVFPLLFPAVLHPISPLCKLFIMDHGTFKRQIYGQIWRDCVFQDLEPNAPGTKSVETVGEQSCRLCSYETKVWPPGTSRACLLLLVDWGGPLEFPVLRSSQGIVKRQNDVT